jgi:hypothetical protein
MSLVDPPGSPSAAVPLSGERVWAKRVEVECV